MPNRLAASTSPYLQQHRDNPVDWWEWSDDAFDEARRRDVPVLLSVGYAACHWCHVMAHESFEDEDIAALMNERFVSIKVDREERPDVDAVYMEATQALTGNGGWPMTVVMTPDGEPFYAGTYFPPEPRHGMPSFPQLLVAVSDAWAARRDETLAAGRRIAAALADRAPSFPGGPPPDESVSAAAVHALGTEYDRVNGGFGTSPKFPPSMVCEFLLRRAARTGDAEALAMAEGTLEAMARGGIYDQLAGGFARYSVDAGWVVPHFEKMLYDNALLLRVYAHWWRLTGSPLAERVATRTADWLLREMRTEEGGFASSLDADAAGVEGSTYVWTRAELDDVLGPRDGGWAATLLEVTEAGTFEHGASTLQLLDDPGPDEDPRWATVRDRLLEARAARPQPARDDKVVTAWNGLAAAALVECGVLFDRADWVAAAEAALDLVLRVHGPVERLVRTSRLGVAGPHAAVLEDRADLAEGLLAAYAATGRVRWVEAARGLLADGLAEFSDGAGGFYDTSDDATDVRLRAVRRPQDPGDGPTPSGQFAAAGALLTWSALTGSAAHREAAEAALGVAAPLAGVHPRFVGSAMAVAEALLDGPREVAVVGPRDDPATLALVRAALRAPAPGVALAWAGPEEPPAVELLESRPLVEGRPAAYVCRQFACQAPVTTPAALSAALARAAK